ncbi:hypothetical protein I5Q34_25450 [Streptomyces sp. AV19]|uniref:hypothetical protein n=1 Tax=Streptomyces sp. AV19 TaxID=2793068 RepID=UPI0018FE9FB2|nr:hypothetical protein [Streptomyces sp. AV19]MBH1937576.1 hypothetical protein [Streptomyces sp. AV19]MDG4533591.1 hypothetical protein [Streptomyces sp. AV19]
MKFSRLLHAAAPLALAVAVTSAPAADARLEAATPRHDWHCQGQGYKDTAVPAVGRTWLADMTGTFTGVR